MLQYTELWAKKPGWPNNQLKGNSDLGQKQFPSMKKQKNIIKIKNLYKDFKNIQSRKCIAVLFRNDIKLVAVT